MVDYGVYLLYRTGIWLVALLPLPLLFAIGQFAGTMAWLISHRYRALALRNVRIAFGNELSRGKARQLVRRHFQRLGANLLCSVKFTEMPIAKIFERIELENFEPLESCFRRKQPVVLLLSHVGLWELSAQLLPHVVPEYRKSTIYQKLRNPYIDRHIRSARGRFGLDVFERSEGFGKAIELLRSGGGIGILCDQHAGDGGIWTPFFGRLASTTPLPALLARRTNAQLLAMAVHTSGFARWRAVVEGPFRQEGESIESVTFRTNEIIEKQIRSAPEDWFWVHDRWKTPYPNFLLARYKRGVFLPPNARPQPFRILIRSSNWLGDAVMSVPAVRAIKRGRPDAHVTIAAPENIADLWNTIPEVDTIIALPRKTLFSAVRLLRREPRFDVAILFPNSLRSGLEALLARIPRRVGFSGHWRNWLLNQRPRQTKARGIVHQSYRYLELASTVGIKVRPEFPPADPIKSRGRPFRFALCPGAEFGPTKRWLPERFAAVARQIASQVPAQWVLFGTENDIAIGHQIAEAVGKQCSDRIGQTTLAQLIQELRDCDLLLTNDTGTMHLAALLGIPTVSIFGSTEPKRTGPLGVGHRILRHHVECSPCFLRDCPLDFRCMREITVAEVATAILQMIPAQAPGVAHPS
ncbi:MAG: heptosyltransferase [Verrucomicrobiota bacterium]|jgi:lipopolysaccharide heptosyltransferase II